MHAAYLHVRSRNKFGMTEMSAETADGGALG